ncbi:hypothetical protein ZIOFF_074135 [Zingiber officinale]|uniref:Uncharacterized protein n=1 Tax=Zingiber officinale TaxID=94328 RepID=A0A8J5BZN2_ZINOF|nr:hypothetical protein ZIOFF_074135 [Zingiber officinale]
MCAIVTVGGASSMWEIVSGSSLASSPTAIACEIQHSGTVVNATMATTIFSTTQVSLATQTVLLELIVIWLRNSSSSSSQPNLSDSDLSSSGGRFALNSLASLVR